MTKEVGLIEAVYLVAPMLSSYVLMSGRSRVARNDGNSVVSSEAGVSTGVCLRLAYVGTSR